MAAVIRKPRAARHRLLTTTIYFTLGVLFSSNGHGQAFEPPAITPLSQVGIPDVNVMGLLDKTGPNADQWTFEPITNPGQQQALQVLGKAFFWDMQTGSDGIQGCASCHFHAGADNRTTHQVNPHGGKTNNDLDPLIDIPGLSGENGELFAEDYGNTLPGTQIVLADLAANGTGIPADEAGRLAAPDPATPDDLVTGIPGAQGEEIATDVNDIVGSQGIAAGV